ncbi:MAG: zinc ribbon domain-containing protein [Thermoplasmata archaeon]|nr:zinc ribbon domain-containing protein [Thermoplasmata archaeon]
MSTGGFGTIVLEDPVVYPREVEKGEKVIFLVTVRNENGTPPHSVMVWVEGRWWDMEVKEGEDLNYTRGVIYMAEVEVRKDVDRVIFVATDVNGNQTRLEYNVTVRVEESSSTLKYLCYAILAIFAITLLLSIVQRIRYSKRASMPPPRPPEPGEAICSSCGRAIPADAKVCPYCGERFEGEEYVCSSCGKVVSPADVVCPHCGAKLKPTKLITDPDELKLSAGKVNLEGKRVCPRCGAVILPDMEECPGCGMRVEEMEKEKRRKSGKGNLRKKKRARGG